MVLPFDNYGQLTANHEIGRPLQVADDITFVVLLLWLALVGFGRISRLG